MFRLRYLLTAAASVALLGATANPASAAKAMSWNDVLDDAVVAGLPIPAAPLSNPGIDITKATIQYDGKTVVWTLAVKSASAQTYGGTGVWYAFEFDYGDGHFTMRVNRDQVSGNTFEMQEDAGQSQVSTVSCVRCNAKVDSAKNTVVITTPFASLASGVRSAAGKDQLAPGKTFTGLTATAGVMYGSPVTPLLWSGPWDSAPAPEPAEFTF
jgi:hypothetical protein